MSLQKNVASQKWRVFAFDKTTGTPKTGDAANITAKIDKDWAGVAAMNDVNPTEVEDGYYLFDMTQAETNADNLDLYPESATANIVVIGVPGSMLTAPVSFSDNVMRGTDDAATAAALATAQADLDIITGASGALLDPTATSAQLVDDVLDEVITGALHNDANSLARRIRLLSESGVYSGGLAWLDTNVANIGSDSFEDGTDVNPTSTETAINTILAAVPLHGVHVAAGSSVLFAASQENQEWTGQDWTLALGGQSIAGSTIIGAIVSGISTGVPGAIRDCFLNASTFAGGDFINCALGDTVTLGAANGYHFFNCHHAEMGAVSTLDFNAAIGASEVHLHDWHGAIQILNMKAGDILHFGCSDGHITLDASCVGGTLSWSGTFGRTDNSSGQVHNDLGLMYQRVGPPVGVDISADIEAIPTTAMRGTDDAALAAVVTATRMSELDAGTPGKMANQVDEIRDDTGEIGTSGAGLGDLGGMSTAMKAEVNAEIVDTLVTDTYAEPGQGALPATASLKDKIGYVYKFVRNKLTNDGTTIKVFSDGGVVDHKATTSEVAGTVTRDKFTTGP